MNSGRRVVITGASGFIGRWGARAAAMRGYEVHAIVSPPGIERAAGIAELNGCEIHGADLFDRVAVRELINRVQPTHLLHMAWCARAGYWNNPDNFKWVCASLELLDNFIQIGGVRAVMAGSCAEYDWTRVTVCDEDTSPLATDGSAVATPYATCKIACEKMVAAKACRAGLSNAWGRIFFQYGPHEEPGRLVASVINHLLRGEEAKCSHGMQVRSFLHVEDVGDAFVALLDSNVAGPVNIGSEERVTIAELVEMVASRIGRRDLVRLGAKPAGNEPPVLLPALVKLQRDVGWTAKYRLADGLVDAISWWKQRMRTVSDESH